jgi:ATP synthase protein I
MHHLHEPHAGRGNSSEDSHDKCQDERSDQEFQKPLTRREVQALKEKLGGVSLEVFLLNVLMWQVLVGIAIAVLAGMATGSVLTTYSAFYGAMCVVLPSALIARTVIRRSKRDVLQHSGGKLVGLFVLELVKILVTVCLLLAAPVVLGSPQWIALVVGFVATLKVYWVVALMGLGQAKHVKKIGINE